MTRRRGRSEIREDPAPAAAARPFAPSPKTLIALAVVFIVWVGILLAMYVKTVLRTRAPHASPATTRSG